jgi:repressor LexA
MGRKALPTDEMNLTERERRMLDFMKERTVEKGYPPTVREICEELEIKSTSTVHKDLSSLELKGFIKKDPSKPRAIEIIGFDRFNSEASSVLYTQRADIADIPLIGQVAAGIPILAEQNVTDTFPVPARYINNAGTHFMLTVKGDSMINAGIFDGDYILVQQQNTAKDGDMVVAMIDGFESEATVKTFYKEGDHIRLQPENSSMSPIIVRDVRILGIVKGVFRYFDKN